MDAIGVTRIRGSGSTSSEMGWTKRTLQSRISDIVIWRRLGCLKKVEDCSKRAQNIKTYMIMTVQRIWRSIQIIDRWR